MRYSAAFLAGSASLFLLAPISAGALTITPTNDAFGLANTLILNSSGLALQSANAFGAVGQLGTYQNTSGTLGLPLTGIVLSSGNVSDFGDTAFDVPATEAQNALLAPITGRDSHNDVAQLDIRFIAQANVSSVTFFGVFGSAEWPEFVTSPFNDGFGLYVNGVNVAGVQTSGGGDNLPVNVDHPDMVPAPAPFAGGVLAPNGNPILRFDVPVNPGQVNDFTIILGDASDSVLDTGVFLSSFFSQGGVVNDGSSEFNPLLPSNPPDPQTGAFVIALPDNLPDNQNIWIDPPIAVGYTYELTGQGVFASLIAPSLASVADLDGYFITVGATSVALAAGGSLDFLTEFGVQPTSFTLTGINPALSLDPADGAAFPLGVSFVGLGPSSFITQTPIVITPNPIPLPAGIWLMLGALGGLSLLRRKGIRAL